MWEFSKHDHDITRFRGYRCPALSTAARWARRRRRKSGRHCLYCACDKHLSDGQTDKPTAAEQQQQQYYKRTVSLGEGNNEFITAYRQFMCSNSCNYIRGSIGPLSSGNMGPGQPRKWNFVLRETPCNYFSLMAAFAVSVPPPATATATGDCFHFPLLRERLVEWRRSRNGVDY